MRTLTPFEAEILGLIEPAADELGYEIVRVRVMGGETRRLQIMAERKSDALMDVEDCARLSREISPILDAADAFAGRFILEVSSPGVDRPLVRLSDFERYEGFEARIELDRLIEGRKRFKGELCGVDGDNVLIALEGEEDQEAAIPFGWIVKAKLVMSDALMRAGAAKDDEGAPTEDD